MTFTGDCWPVCTLFSHIRDYFLILLSIEVTQSNYAIVRKGRPSIRFSYAGAAQSPARTSTHSLPLSSVPQTLTKDKRGHNARLILLIQGLRLCMVKQRFVNPRPHRLENRLGSPPSLTCGRSPTLGTRYVDPPVVLALLRSGC